jgi:phage gpG-like protein
MSNTIYLYLKTHNQTGLKYLGKTVKDPFEYKGSGKYWLRHIKKYGYDVTTEILFQTEDEKLFKKVSLEYSNKLNIVESNEYANIVPEQGDGGYVPRPKESYEQGYLTKKQRGLHLNSGKKEARQKARNTALKRYNTLKTGDNESRKKGWKTRRERGTDKGWICPPESFKRGWDTRKEKGTNTWTIEKIVTCPHCGKIGKKAGAMYQWHFDNCKYKE